MSGSTRCQKGRSCVLIHHSNISINFSCIYVTDTDGFVIPSLTIEDSDFANTNVPAVTEPIPHETTTKETEKIYLGPHGAPPQAKQQESNATGHKQRSKHKLREADQRWHSGIGRGARTR
ncbi:uncharacterized protein LOC122053261 isoform X1 [Zingiber officinale]|uniref:uncharacterized protein LOC122053261 isoform X1 n=1 Tax=Zingiber officinale TaxID=94328 RepID=UPI001C4B1AAF|nr:uncharacterized protein LOC122053261 isoform X1 [Zingiber officinale]